MEKMVIAAFNNMESADAAVDELGELGYSTQDISIISKDNREHASNTLAENTADGALSGAATGGVIGGAAGLLAGAGILPALAGLLIGGPIAAALGATGVVATTISGAVTGAAAGGLIGALTGLGVSNDDATYYNKAVEDGGIILAVPSRDSKDQHEVRNVLEANGAQHINEVTSHPNSAA